MAIISMAPVGFGNRVKMLPYKNVCVMLTNGRKQEAGSRKQEAKGNLLSVCYV